MSRQRRDVEVRVDARRLESLDVGLGGGGVASASASGAASAATAGGGIDFTASIADEHDFGLLLEGIQVGDVIRPDGAAAEDADMRERVEMGEGD